MVDNSVLNENGKTYLVIDTVQNNNIEYIYFVNQGNPRDFFIRKEIVKDEKNYLVNLDNKEEFDYALNLFKEKHENE